MDLFILSVCINIYNISGCAMGMGNIRVNKTNEVMCVCREGCGGVVLGVEPKASHMPGKWSLTELRPQPK